VLNIPENKRAVFSLFSREKFNHNSFFDSVSSVFERKFSRRILNLPLIHILTDHLIDYPTSPNLTYFWGFGSAAGIFLVVQIISGVILAMHYSPHVSLAFLSVEHIVRDVNGGWFIRYCHANGASFFFLSVYIHLFRGVYYSSYKGVRAIPWSIGVLIFILMMACAFMGYVLPWGQMSLWAATVITNLFSAFPWVGNVIVYWVWGGFSVDNATLNRFFSLHFLLPFLIVACVILHISFIHLKGSNNPLGISNVNKISFYPNFWTKDLFVWLVLSGVYLTFVFFLPNILGHPDNYIAANPLVTPSHITPEWYFLPFYAILRSIPDKLSGVCLMFGGLLILFFTPVLNLSVFYSFQFLVFQQFSFWFLVVAWFILGWTGACAPEPPFLGVGQTATIYYFMYFLFWLPFFGYIESIF
jgi:quinol-cytochrome oxidoreductase complex cytochrome b subunit